MLVYILCVLVLLLYVRHILTAILFLLWIPNAKFQKNRSCVLCKILAFPCRAVEKFLLRNGGLRYLVYRIGLIPSHHLRKWAYRCLGAEVESCAVFHFRTEIRDPWRLHVGKGTIVGDNVILDARNGLRIGSNVNFSSNVSVYTKQHNHRDPYFSCETNRKQSVEIDNRVWLGSNVVVLSGVHIGEGAVCCAGCVVTKDVEPYAVVAGVPAVKVGERPRDLRYEFTGESVRLL